MAAAQDRQKENSDRHGVPTQTCSKWVTWCCFTRNPCHRKPCRLLAAPSFGHALWDRSRSLASMTTPIRWICHRQWRRPRRSTSACSSPITPRRWMTLRVRRARDLTNGLVHHLRQVVRSQGWDSRSSKPQPRHSDEPKSPRRPCARRGGGSTQDAHAERDDRFPEHPPDPRSGRGGDASHGRARRTCSVDPAPGASGSLPLTGNGVQQPPQLQRSARCRAGTPSAFVVFHRDADGPPPRREEATEPPRSLVVGRETPSNDA